jgi:hypothetical protein
MFITIFVALLIKRMDRKEINAALLLQLNCRSEHDGIGSA